MIIKGFDLIFSIFKIIYGGNTCALDHISLNFDMVTHLVLKELCALSGKFGLLWSQKLKVAFHQFHQFGLLED